MVNFKEAQLLLSALLKPLRSSAKADKMPFGFPFLSLSYLIAAGCLGC
jgi:hypothetical protein